MSTAVPSSSLPLVSSKEKFEKTSECKNCSILENEAFAAVCEVASFVKIICMSEVLTRTPELLFLNLVTLEDKCYCVELTQRGWRICSERQDCMYGNFQQLDLFSQYFETVYQLLDQISPEYQKKFSEKLAERLNQIVE